MRWLVVTGLVAACYQPASEVPCTVSCVPGGTCPDGTSCGSALRCEPIGGPACPIGGSGSDGGSADAQRFLDAPPTLCQFGGFSHQDTLAGGNWYTPDRPDSRAVFTEATTSDVYYTQVLDSTSMTDYMQLFTPASTGAISLSAARLAPGGTEIFVLVNKSTVSQLQASDFATSWGPLAPVTLFDESNNPVVLSSSNTPGAPSGTKPRRMPIATSSGFDEYEEVTTGTWKRIMSYTANDLGLASLGDPSFTSDGRRVAFMSVNGGPISVFYSERPDLGSKFSGNTSLVSPTGGGQMPYISADCLHVYCTGPSGVQHIY